MDKKKVLIVCDAENLPYWDTLSKAVIKKIGSIDKELYKNITPQIIAKKYDLIILDISIIENLYSMISTLHQNEPSCRIIVVSSVPTWKFTREVLRLGAADMIHKGSDPDKILQEL